MSHKNGTATMPAAPPIEKDLPIGAIDPSPHNVRKKFDPVELQDLADNFKVHGVLVRLLVWQPDPRRERYELIDGEKRLRSGKIGLLSVLPVKIVHTDRKGARELMLICTVQRSNPTDAELADSFAELVEQHGYTAEKIVERIGLPLPRVRELIKIGRQLPSLARDALDAGRIALSTAGLIARVPGEKARDEAARWVVAGDDRSVYGYRVGKPPTDGEVKRAIKDEVQALNFVQTRKLIGERYMVQLKQAPFSQEDPGLLPSAGSCKSCPKRTGNAPEDYPDSRGDVCTDPSCYAEKQRCHSQRLMEQHRAAGRKVLSEKQAAKLCYEYASGPQLHGVEYVDLGVTCDQASGNKTWKKLVGKQLEAEITVAVDCRGQVHELAPRKRAEAVLRKEQAKNPQKESAADARHKREQAERRAKAKAGKAAAFAANGLVAERAQAMFAQAIGFSKEDVARLRALVQAATEFCWNEASHAVEVRRGAAAKGDHRDGRKSRNAVVGLADEVSTAGELLGILAELIAARASVNWGSEYYVGRGEFGDFWKAWNVDPKKLRAEAVQASKEKANGKGNKGQKNGSVPMPPPVDPASAPTDIEPWRDQLLSDLELSPATRRLCEREQLATAGQAADWLDNVKGLNGVRRDAAGDLIEAIYALRKHSPRSTPKPPESGGVSTSEAWRNITLTDLHLSKKAERLFRKMKLLCAGEVADWLERGEDRGLGRFLLNDVRAVLDRARFAPPAESKFRLGLRVKFSVDGRTGRITGSQRGPDKPNLWYVLWDLGPGEKKQGAGYFGEDKLTILPDEPAATTARFEIGDRVTLAKEPGRIGVLVSISKRGGDVEQYCVAWERWPGERKQKTEWREGADLVHAKTPAPSKAETVAKRNAERKCRVCGCTDADCRQCIEATGHPCTWVDEDLCSRCADEQHAKLGAEMEASHA